MHWEDSVDKKRRTVRYSLRDLRKAKGITQSQLAQVLGISKSLYHSIESGHRKPSADVLHILAAVYQTSMDFVYHAFHRQHFVWSFPDADLQYAMREAKNIDIQYLREREGPAAPPRLPAAIIIDYRARELV